MRRSNQELLYTYPAHAPSLGIHAPSLVLQKFLLYLAYHDVYSMVHIVLVESCNSFRCICRIAAGTASGLQDQLDQVELPLTEPKPDDSPPPDVDLARIGPLKVALEEVVDEGQGAGLLAAVLQVIPGRALDLPQNGLPAPTR